MKPAQYVFDNAESNPEKIAMILKGLNKHGITKDEIIQFIEEAQRRMVSFESPTDKTFDVCGTGGSGQQRINLSTALAIKLSTDFTIAKHGNKAASGKVGSFDLIEALNYEIGDTPDKAIEQLKEKNLSFLFAPAFHPALGPLAPIRKSLGEPTVFNYLGPVLNPVTNLTAQMTGVSSAKIGQKMAEVAAKMRRNVLFVYDKAFGLDDVSIGGQTHFWKVKDGKIETGYFEPEDYGLPRVKKFEDLTGGTTAEESKAIFQALIDGTAPKAHLDFLEINRKVAAEFFNEF